MEDRRRVRLLIDTNIILEVLLAQEKALEARFLLRRTEEHEFFISDYSLHTIGLLLFRRGQHDIFRQFLDDMILKANTVVLSLPAEEMGTLFSAAEGFDLDFDDAYQHAVAEKYGLTIVSFDANFDRTERGRKTPADF